LERICPNGARRAGYDKKIRKFLAKNPPEKVREIIAESGTAFPEAPFKSEAHCQSYFRRVQNLLPDELKSMTDDTGETSSPEAEEEEAPVPDTGTAPPLPLKNSWNRPSEGKDFMTEESGG